MIALLQEWNDRCSTMLCEFVESKLVEEGCDESNFREFSITIPIQSSQTIRQIRRNGVLLGTVSLNITDATFSCEWERT